MIAKIIIILAVGILIGVISFILKINRRPYKEWRDGKKSKPYNEIFPEVKKNLSEHEKQYK
jgi:hypothetical protein